VAIGDRVQGCLQVGKGLDAIDLACFDQGGDAAPSDTAFIVTGKESAFLQFRAIGRIRFSTLLLSIELLSNLVFEACRSCGDLVWGCGFNSVFEPDAGDDFGEVVKAA
jgi:hypothetical protein